jgi:outer membrane lipoprotein-sorting protein
MRRSVLCVPIAVAAAVLPASAETLDEVLDRHFAAVGGKEKLAAVKTAKMTGKQQFGPQEAPFTIYWKRPDKVRMEFTLQGMTGIQAYDGTQAWMVMPFMGKTEPEAMTGDDLKQMQDQADMVEGPLFRWKEKGHQVELIGKETVEGTEAWKVKLTRKSGDVSHAYLDAESMLQIKSEAKVKRGDQEIEIVGSLGDYKEVDGIVLPFSIEQRPKGAPAGSMITIEAIELNGAIDDALFAMPAKKEEPAPAAK